MNRIDRLDTSSRAAAIPSAVVQGGPNTVAGLVRTRVVRLPVWFTAVQALRVAELRNVDCVLVEEHGRVRGAISRRVLAEAHAAEPLARIMVKGDAVVSPDTSIEGARALMLERGLPCLSVVRDGILLGTVSYLDILDHSLPRAA